jgi:hypothetical protein
VHPDHERGDRATASGNTGNSLGTLLFRCGSAEEMMAKTERIDGFVKVVKAVVE